MSEMIWCVLKLSNGVKVQNVRFHAVPCVGDQITIIGEGDPIVREDFGTNAFVVRKIQHQAGWLPPMDGVREVHWVTLVVDLDEEEVDC
jgi:hypothetical protein